MNVASLELCKELYELSGWIPIPSLWYRDGGLVYHDYNLLEDADAIPAYDLSYLLRKLPAHASVHKLGRGRDGQFYTEHHKTPFGEIRVDADTPEDAAAHLAIELFKQNILTKP